VPDVRENEGKIRCKSGVKVQVFRARSNFFVPDVRENEGNAPFVANTNMARL
jgi:hypothetical protein